jgi:hypothetical protein
MLFWTFSFTNLALKCLTCGDLVCGISHIGKGFQSDFSFASSSMKCLISRSLSDHWKWLRCSLRIALAQV